MSWLIIVFVILIVFHNLQTCLFNEAYEAFKHFAANEISINIDCLEKIIIRNGLFRANTRFSRSDLRCYRKYPAPEDDDTSHDSFLLFGGDFHGRSF